MAKEYKTEITIGGKVSKTLAKALKTSEKNISTSFKQISQLSKTVVKGAAAMAAGVATALVAAAESTREYRTEQAKLISAFEAANGSADVAKGTYKALYRVLGDEGQATEAASLLSQITTNEKELAEWTNACQGVYATFGASLPIEAMVESANETARVGKITGSLADAINWTTLNTDNWSSVLGANSNALKAYENGIKAGLSQEDAFNEALAKLNSQSDREALIRATLNSTYANAASSYEKNAAGVLASNDAQAKLTESMASIGGAVEPIITAFRTFSGEVLAQLAPQVQLFAENYLPSIQSALMSVGDTIGVVISWIVDNWEFVSTLASIIIGIATAMGIVNTVISITNALMLVSPTTWIILGIVAAVVVLIAIIRLCVKHWDGIREGVANVFGKVKTIISNVIAWIKENFLSIILFMINPFAGIFHYLYNHCEGFRNFINNIINKIKTIISNVINWVKTNLVSVILFLINPFAGIFSYLYNNCEGFRNFVNNVINSIKGFFIGLWEKIKSVFSAVGNFFKTVFTNAYNSVVNVFSKVVGFFTGIWEKIKAMFTKIGTTVGNAISNAFKTVVNAIINFAESRINGFIRAINGAIGLINKISGGSITKITELSIPRLATGGTFDGTQPQLSIVGDAPETMVPHGNTPRNRALLETAAKGVGVKLGSNVNIVFAPVISGGSGADVRQAIRDSEIEFEERMDAYIRKKGRVSFA